MTISFDHKECLYYTEPAHGELVWCTQPANKDQCEGYCRKDTCPLLLKGIK